MDDDARNPLLLALLSLREVRALTRPPPACEQEAAEVAAAIQKKHPEFELEPPFEVPGPPSS
jgi:hypothetical protein